MNIKRKNSFRQWLEVKTNSLFDFDVEPRKEISRKRITENYVITCWRGTSMESLDKHTISKNNTGLTVNTVDAMEGIYWFSHSLQRGMLDPEDYARNYAKDILITYPLTCNRVYDLVKYEDGSEQKEMPNGLKIPDYASKSNVGVIAGIFYYLPQGWFFTWQVQKFIAFEGQLRIENSMLERV